MKIRKKMFCLLVEKSCLFTAEDVLCWVNITKENNIFFFDEMAESESKCLRPSKCEKSTLKMFYTWNWYNHFTENENDVVLNFWNFISTDVNEYVSEKLKKKNGMRANKRDRLNSIDPTNRKREIRQCFGIF